MKDIKWLFLFLICFCFNMNFVNAMEQSHIYMVENLNFSNNDILTIDGYSFVSHRDNYGGKNLNTYIVAYTGSRGTTADWWDIFPSGSSSNTNINAMISTCNSNSNCYIVKADTVSRDFWWSRCTGSGCKYESVALTRASQGQFVNDTSCTSSVDSNGNNYGGSHCVYYNVGFSAKLNLKSILEKFSDGNYRYDRTINFAIVASISGGGKSVYSTNMGVYPAFCHVNGTGSCSNGAQIDSGGNYTVNVGNMSREAHYDAIDSGGYNNSSATSYAAIFAHANNYNILNLDKKKTFSLTKGGVTGSFVDEIFLLNSVFNGSLLVPSNNGSSGYWAFANRIHITGSFTISGLAQKVISRECDYLDVGTSQKENIVSCGNEGMYKQCSKVKNINASKQIYYPTNSNCTGMSGKQKINGNWYVPIDVSTSVLFYQEATFKFGDIPQKASIYAGKGFTLDTTTYTNSVTWVIADIHPDDFSPYYNYSGVESILSGGSCNNQTINFNEDALVYYYASDGSLLSATLKEAAFYVISGAAEKKIDTSSVDDIKFKSCDSNSSTNCDVNNPNYEVSGSWSKIGDTTIENSSMKELIGRKITNNYQYNLANSYVVLNGDQNGKALYIENVESEIDSYKNTGEKYYIDFKWKSRLRFPFDLEKNINPSFLKSISMNWKLNGMCSITVKDGYYTEGEGGKIETLLKYRSINVDNPFPKGNIPSNWQKWWEKTSNQTRIKNSYGDYPDHPLYEITLSKYEIPDAKSISDIANYGEANGNDSYASTKTISLDGSSKFVKLFFSVFVRESDRLYCPLGTFKQECDLGR